MISFKIFVAVIVLIANNGDVTVVNRKVVYDTHVECMIDASKTHSILKQSDNIKDSSFACIELENTSSI